MNFRPFAVLFVAFMLVLPSMAQAQDGPISLSNALDRQLSLAGVPDALTPTGAELAAAVATLMANNPSESIAVYQELVAYAVMLNPSAFEEIAVAAGVQAGANGMSSNDMSAIAGAAIKTADLLGETTTGSTATVANGINAQSTTQVTANGVQQGTTTFTPSVWDFGFVYIQLNDFFGDYIIEENPAQDASPS